MQTRWLDNPGSEQARKQGCCCPVLDNYSGRGRRGDGEQHGWYIHANCPLHGSMSPANAQPPAGHQEVTAK